MPANWHANCYEKRPDSGDEGAMGMPSILGAYRVFWQMNLVHSILENRQLFFADGLGEDWPHRDAECRPDHIVKEQL